MMRPILLLVLLLLGSPSPGLPTASKPGSSPTKKETAAKAAKADVSTPAALVQAAYESISGGVGKERDWKRMRALWLKSARIVLSSENYEGKIRYENLNLEDYISRVTDFYQEEGFFTVELAQDVQRFGNIAHIWSTFEIRKGSLTGPVVNRGINSWQLVKNDGRWWISHLSMDFESSRQPIPDRYLKP